MPNDHEQSSRKDPDVRTLGEVGTCCAAVLRRCQNGCWSTSHLSGVHWHVLCITSTYTNASPGLQGMGSVAMQRNIPARQNHACGTGNNKQRQAWPTIFIHPHHAWELASTPLRPLTLSAPLHPTHNSRPSLRMYLGVIYLLFSPAGLHMRKLHQWC